MIRQQLSRLLVFACASSVVGCNCGTSLQQSSGVLALPAADLTYSNVCVGNTATQNFVINDDSRTALTIEKIEISASAFQISPPVTFPAVIPADGSMTFSVAFTPTNNGTFSATMTITSNAAMNPTAVATLLGSTFTGNPMYPKMFDVTCACDRSDPSNVACGLPPDAGVMPDDPCEFLSYTNVSDGTMLSRTVALVNQGCEPITVTPQLYDANDGGTSDPATALFNLGNSGTITVQGGQTEELSVTFSPTGTQELTPNVRLRLQSDALNPVCGQTPAGQCSATTPGLADLGLLANSVEPQLIVTPTTLSFFSTAMGQTGSQTFTVQNAGDAPLPVTSIALQPDPGTTDFALQLVDGQSSFTLAAAGDPSGNDTRTETVTFVPTKSATQHAVITVSASGATATINVYGGISPQMTVQWMDPSTMTLTAPPVDFGMTAPDAMGLMLTVVLTNSGSADLDVMSAVTKDITNMNPSNSFSVSGFPSGGKTLAPMQTLSFTIVFNDDLSISNDSGKLDITSNDAVDVANDNGLRIVDLISENTADPPPTANISLSPSSDGSGVAICGSLTLDGSQTVLSPTAPTGDSLQYQWSVTKKPSGSTVMLSTPTDVMTAVVSASCSGPDLVGEYQFELVASDEFPINTSAPATVTVTVQ